MWVCENVGEGGEEACKSKCFSYTVCLFSVRTTVLARVLKLYDNKNPREGRVI